MPLSFKSESHGAIAFGFFNIESDMLLLQDHFFFADRFCEWIIELSRQKEFFSKGEEKEFRINSPVYHMAAHDVGDLMGAIHGMRFTGFMGTLYQRFPFPQDPKDFKQNPQGDETREIVIREIEKFATLTEFPIEVSKEGQIHLGPYVFSRQVLFELILYVWQGGYPRWKDKIRPAYVDAMKSPILESANPFFQGFRFTS